MAQGGGPGSVPPPLVENGNVRVRRCRYGLMLYTVRDIYVGRSLDLYGEYSELEVDLFRHVIRPGWTVLDVGANIGAHTIFYASAVGEAGTVYAFEPQRFVHQMLCANLALNGIDNVRAYFAALGKEPGTVPVPQLDFRRDGNFGGLGLESAAQGENVPVLTIDDLTLGRCDFLKIDVEGMEEPVLIGAEKTISRHRPVLYVENDRRSNSPKLISRLIERDYRLYWHMPPLFNPNNFLSNPENVFGRTVTVNLLGLPKERPQQIGLPEVQGPDDWPSSLGGPKG